MILGFIGSGAMSGAIARGLHSADPQATMTFFDTNQRAATALADETGGTVAASLEEMTKSAQIIILGVKPHVQRLVLQQLAPLVMVDNPPALLSIAAGRTLANIFQDLSVFGVQDMPPLIRVMPNVNAQIGLSMSAVAFCPGVPDDIKAQTFRIVEAIGQAVEIPEDHFPVFSALAGASPAWFFQIIDSFARAGVKHGLTKEMSVRIVTQAMVGSSQMVQVEAARGIGAPELVDRVCSPGGTTIAGLLAAQAAGLDTALVRAVDATIRRDHELAS